MTTSTSNHSSQQACENHDEQASNGRKLSEAELIKQEKLAQFCSELNNHPRAIASMQMLLSLILQFLEIVLDENMFRYLLGMISVYTVLTNKMVAECARCSTKLVQKGRKEVLNGECPSIRYQRRAGAGRKSRVKQYPALRNAIIQYVRLRSYGPCTKGTQEYTAATLKSIQKYLEQKHNVKIAKSAIMLVLKAECITLRTNKKLLYGNQKTESETQRVPRHLQFDLIFDTLSKETENPESIVLSCDCKKKEKLGGFKASGKSYTLPGDEVKVGEHDFGEQLDIKTLKDKDDLLDRQQGTAIPYALYDIQMNKAYINLGISHDTPEFVAVSILQFIDRIRADHPDAKKLYLFCDGGGSNNARSNLLKYYLTIVSFRINMPIIVIHYPPYRSKFNKVERAVFAYISKKFERVPLYNLRTVKALIESTTTKQGLRVLCDLDTRIYETGQKLLPEEEQLIRVKFFGATADSSTKLSYIIDGTGLKKEIVPPISPMDVFQYRDQLLEEARQKHTVKKTKKDQKAKEQAEQRRQDIPDKLPASDKKTEPGPT